MGFVEFCGVWRSLWWLVCLVIWLRGRKVSLILRGFGYIVYIVFRGVMSFVVLKNGEGGKYFELKIKC